MTPLVRYKIVTGEAWIIKETPGAPRVLREGEDIYRADEVEQQFTAMTQERDNWRDNCTDQSMYLNKQLKTQLATVMARVTRLEQALTTLLRKYAPGCPDELKNQLREVQQAREALRGEL